MNAIIFDTETNGKIIDWKMPLRNDETISNFPRITQLAWQKVNLTSGEIVNEYQSLIQPAGWTVPKEQFFIDNNMSTERCKNEGKPLREVLPLIIEDLRDSEIVVAHNMSFDINVLGAELIRLNYKVGKELIKVCTMQETIDMCKLPGQYGKYKFPKLTELYQILFEKEFDGAHDAMVDVTACKECFMELIKLNHLKF